MRPINLTEDQKLKLFESFLAKFKEEVDDSVFSSGNNSITIKTNLNEVSKEKVTITYTQAAYLKMLTLVDYFDSEVAWYGLTERLEDKHFRIYDVKMCKQYVSGAKVDTEDADTLEFFNSLSDEEADHMHFQAHSHVKMSTEASGTDMQNQADVIHNMGKTGYYIFQIWNKNGDINTYLYDLDNNVFYDRKDVVIEIEEVDDFILSIVDLVQEKKYPYQWNNQFNNNFEKNTKGKKGKEEKDDYMYWYGQSSFGSWEDY